MSLDILEKRDQKTVSGILAAAALSSTANVAGDEPAIAKTYRAEAQELLTEIRKALRIDRDDNSSRAALSISNFLAKQLQETILGTTDTSKILARAGEAGRLPPVMYAVEQPKGFLNFFRNLSIRPSDIEDAVKHPDDYQHLMTELARADAKDMISLFMKEVRSAKPNNDHWLLVQTHRVGLSQVVQSAWRVFPDEVDLEGATQPLDVLKAFVAKFGLPLKIMGEEFLFLESKQFPKSDNITLALRSRTDREGFASVSHTQTSNPEIVQVGIGYSIDIPKYRAFLFSRGLVDKEVVSVSSVAQNVYGTRV